MNYRGHGFMAASIALGLTVASCGGVSKPPPTGILTGTLERCTLHLQTQSVQVIGTNGKVVASQPVVPGRTYRFVLPLGRYFISTGGPLEKAHPDDLLQAAQTVHQNFPPYLCN